MKLTRSLHASYRGSVLLITITVVAISAIVLGSYFTLVQYQTASVARSQAWNASIALTESGIEEGMALINRKGIVTDKWAWTASLDSESGWSAWAGNTASLTRYMMTTNIYGAVSSNYYVTTITNIGDAPQISSQGYVPHTSIPWVFGSEKYLSFLTMPLRPFLAAAGVDNGATTTAASGTINTVRRVKIDTVTDPLFTMPLVTKDNIDLNGQNITTDSFNSAITNYSMLKTNSVGATNWVYDVTKRRAKGDIGTNSKLVGAANIGNANIWGKLHTGPGSVSTTADIGPGGKVGDETWQAGSTDGFQTGAWLYDMNVEMPAVGNPASGGLPMQSTTLIGTVMYDKVMAGGVKYEITSTLQGKIYVSGPNAVLWAKGGINFSGNGAGIFLAPGASVSIYVGTAVGGSVTMDLTGQGGVNAGGYAKDCQFFGLPTCTSIKLSGNAAFVGTIYAPNAAVTGSGSGNSDVDCIGSMMVKSVKLNGHWKFHYDEALLLDGPYRGWIAKNWTEVKIN